MYSALELQNPAYSEPLWSGLDAIGIGLFMLDSEGNLVRLNTTAAKIFGVDPNTDTGVKHISSIDAVMSLGLQEKLQSILGGTEKYCRHGISCTNTSGMYKELDICCAASEGFNGNAAVIGIVRDVKDAVPQPAVSANLFEELQILSTVAASLSSSWELEQILEVILTGATASQGLGFNRAFLFFYNPAENCLNGHLAVGPASAEEAGYIWQDLEAKNLSLDELLDIPKRDASIQSSSINSLIKGLSISLDGDSLISTACKRGVWINLETVEDIDSVTAALLDRLGVRKMALVPMISKGNLIGLLAADSKITGRPISNESVQLLQILANQAAVAMERARLYEEQISRASQLEEMNRLLGESQDHIIKIEKMSIIGELTAAIAHELRNPLAVIGGFANMMLKSQITDEQREYLNIISSETTRSESVLSQVLDFHEASKSDRRHLDFSELIVKNLQLVRGRLRPRDTHIGISLSPQTMKIYGNFDQLSHAFYQFFKLVVEDLIPPGSAEVRSEQRDDHAVMIIKIDATGQDRDRVVKAMQRIFSDNKASQRLTVLVAGETIRYHGGNFGIWCDENTMPSLFVELPLLKESQDG
ncbi:MAG: GAF domain-containing sensor histidine kinase [Candidatus Zixiibacteriota bacterium]|nr:MAG: GAF domain-containing sensor histidine kinase [candidate division Zixibacteria bacterium]